MVLRVLIVDDQPAFRAVALELLEADGMVVVGEAAGVADAVRATAELRPDVVVLDVRLPDGSGLNAASALHAMAPAPIVVLTSTADYADVAAHRSVAFVAKAELTGPALRRAIGLP
jgi:DNA-binding NarL/FixJ family response regulator